MNAYITFCIWFTSIELVALVIFLPWMIFEIKRAPIYDEKSATAGPDQWSRKHPGFIAPTDAFGYNEDEDTQEIRAAHQKAEGAPLRGAETIPSEPERTIRNPQVQRKTTGHPVLDDIH